MYHFFLLSYAILGAGIKYIDEAFDEKTFNKKIALIVAPLLGVLWAYTMLINPVSATILLAIIFGIFIKGKIDNLAHLIGLSVILLIVFLAGVELLIPVLIVLATAALLDEIGNDLVDRYGEKLDEKKAWYKIIATFFDQRWMLKIAILGLALLGVISIYFFLAMLLFDEAYLLVRWYSQIRQRGGLPFRSGKPVPYFQKQVFTFFIFNIVFLLFFGMSLL